MKKLIALLLALLMTALVFSSCDPVSEEESSSFEPASEVSSESASEPVSEEESSQIEEVTSIPTEVSSKKLEVSQPPSSEKGSEGEQSTMNWKFYVNGKDIYSDHMWYDSEKEEIAIPLIAMFETLGADIIWKTDTQATFIFDEREYFLDLKNHIFMFNDILDDPNSFSRGTFPMSQWLKEYRVFITEKEIIIDGYCAYSVLRVIGYRVKLDKENKIAELKPYDWMEYCWIEEDSAKEGVSE